MSSVGQQIREQRLRLGLKLEEISAKSRISLKVLRDIENDDLANISSPFLYKSFVRQFAAHIRLDSSELNPALEEAAHTMPEPLIPGEGDLGKTNLPPIPIKGRRKSFRWLYSVASLAFMLIICSSLYGVWQTSKYTWWAELSEKLHASKAKPTLKSPVENASSAPSPDKVESSSTASGDSATARKSLEVRVELSAIERTWLSVAEDGKQTFSGMLDPDQTKVLEGHDTARIRTGNAGGISCVFNGKPIGTLGERGQARTVVFTKTNYKVVEPAPRIALIGFPLYR